VNAARLGTSQELLTLLDWRRRIAELYRLVREDEDPVHAWHVWRDVRDELIGGHPQSPLDSIARASFVGLQYFEYGPEARVLAEVREVASDVRELPVSRGDRFRLTRFAVAEFELHGEAMTLELDWLEEYSGGVFVSFTDETSGSETYGAGRYLLDTAKGADLGQVGDKLVLDFNFAYNASCAYDPRRACPLAPLENRLPLAIRAGEMAPASPG